MKVTVVGLGYVGAVTAENRRELPAEQVGDLLHRGGGDQFGGEFVDLTALGCFDAAAVRQAAYELHVLLIRHGRRTCTARNPDCPACPLKRMCPFGRARLAAA